MPTFNHAQSSSQPELSAPGTEVPGPSPAPGPAQIAAILDSLTPDVLQTVGRLHGRTPELLADNLQLLRVASRLALLAAGAIEEVPVAGQRRPSVRPLAIFKDVTEAAALRHHVPPPPLQELLNELSTYTDPLPDPEAKDTGRPRHAAFAHPIDRPHQH